MSQIKLAIFDLDGVLTETSRQHYLAWKQLADELGLYFDETMNELLKGVSRIDSFNIILEQNKKGAKFTEIEKRALADKKNHFYLNLIESFRPEDLFEGVLELFGALKSRKIHIALASASFNAPMLLEKMQIRPWIDYVVNPGDVKKGKPDPEIFQKAAAHFGVNASEAIGFEDAIAGVKAIKDGNMFAVGIGDSEILTQADLVYPTIKEADLETILNYCDRREV